MEQSMPRMEDAPPLYKPELIEPKKRLTILQRCYKEPWVPIGQHAVLSNPALATQCPSPLLSDWRALSVAGCLTTAAVLSVGFGAFISGNKVLAQNMMCATTSKASPGAALGQLAPEAALSSRSRLRPPRAPICLGQPAAWAALALTHRPDFSTQARPGGGSVHHHCSHGRGDKILARQLRRRHCYSRSHKTGAGGTRPSGCK